MISKRRLLEATLNRRATERQNPYPSKKFSYQTLYNLKRFTVPIESNLRIVTKSFFNYSNSAIYKEGDFIIIEPSSNYHLYSPSMYYTKDLM